MKVTIREKGVLIGDTFDIGDEVKTEGMYICVPCGYQRRYSRGERFIRCFKCLRGMRDEGEPFIKDLGLWEYLGKSVTVPSTKKNNRPGAF